MFALFFPNCGTYTRAINTETYTRSAADELLFDREANGQAFPGEYVGVVSPEHMTPEQRNEERRRSRVYA